MNSDLISEVASHIHKPVYIQFTSSICHWGEAAHTYTYMRMCAHRHTPLESPIRADLEILSPVFKKKNTVEGKDWKVHLMMLNPSFRRENSHRYSYSSNPGL